MWPKSSALLAGAFEKVWVSSTPLEESKKVAVIVRGRFLVPVVTMKPSAETAESATNVEGEVKLPNSMINAFCPTPVNPPDPMKKLVPADVVKLVDWAPPDALKLRDVSRISGFDPEVKST